MCTCAQRHDVSTAAMPRNVVFRGLGSIVSAALLVFATGCFGSAANSASTHGGKRGSISPVAVRRAVSHRRISPFQKGDFLVDLKCVVAANAARARCVGTPSTAGTYSRTTVWFRIRPDGSLVPICGLAQTRIYCRS